MSNVDLGFCNLRRYLNTTNTGKIIHDLTWFDSIVSAIGKKLLEIFTHRFRVLAAAR
jgi:hypothetical protein